MMQAIETPKAMEGTWTLTAPDGRQWQGGSPIQVAGAELRERVPAHVAMTRILDEAFPPHCSPQDVAALIARLEALEDPQREAMPTFENTDWRTLAGVCARVIRHLEGA